MRRFIIGLVILSWTCGPLAFARDDPSATKINFPPSGYRPLPAHFQPRRLIAANLEKVKVAPPPLPSYEQPPIPAQGYLWMPGFWAWRKSVPDYFWVPATWVQPPRLGLLWTPPYWSRVDGGYAFHGGYWSSEVGFYGGISYGYGYSGDGYNGGRWENGTFSYNSAVNNLKNSPTTNIYHEAVKASDDAVRVSFNGGSKGTVARPTEQQEALASDGHIGATMEQQRHFELAAMDRSLYSKLNNGQPGVAATSHIGALDGASITRSKGVVPDHAAQSVDARANPK